MIVNSSKKRPAVYMQRDGPPATLATGRISPLQNGKYMPAAHLGLTVTADHAAARLARWIDRL